MTAHPWMHQTPWPTEQLPREQQQERIEHLLATHWMGVLCTIGEEFPIGSPVEYYAEGTSVYILPQPGSPKQQALQRDPRVCFAVHAENTGWVSVRGAQLFGHAKLLDPGTPEWDHAMTIYRWEPSAVQLGRSLDEPPQVQLMRLHPEKIVYTEQWLRKDGFGPRQIWYSDPTKKAASRKYDHGTMAEKKE